MDNISIKKIKSQSGNYVFEVEVGLPGNISKYFVTLDRDYWQKLRAGQEPVAQLILDSFVFLLKREPKESILKEFNLRIINDYFPEYEKIIKK